MKPKKKVTLRTAVPTSWKGTAEEWREFKRGEWRCVVAALAKFSFGAAYVPVGTDFWDIQRAAERITEAIGEEWVLK